MGAVPTVLQVEMCARRRGSGVSKAVFMSCKCKTAVHDFREHCPLSGSVHRAAQVHCFEVYCSHVK